MEAIMIAGVAVVAVSGWYSVLDLLADVGIKLRAREGGSEKSIRFTQSGNISSQRSVKQMAGVNI